MSWNWIEKLDYPTAETPECDPHDVTSNPVKEPIAIIGMSCRVAGADDVFQFWQNLLSATDVGQNITIDQLPEEVLSCEKENKVRRVYTLDQPEYFDGSSYTPRRPRRSH